MSTISAVESGPPETASTSAGAPLRSENNAAASAGVTLDASGAGMIDHAPRLSISHA